MTLKTKLLVRSVVYGILAQALMLYLAWMVQSEPAARTLGWNMWLALALARASVNTEIVQGLPAQYIFAVIAGLLLGAAAYSTAIYHALRVFAARRPSSARGPIGSR